MVIQKAEICEAFAGKSQQAQASCLPTLGMTQTSDMVGLQPCAKRRRHAMLRLAVAKLTLVLAKACMLPLLVSSSPAALLCHPAGMMQWLMLLLVT